MGLRDGSKRLVCGSTFSWFHLSEMRSAIRISMRRQRWHHTVQEHMETRDSVNQSN